MDFRARQTVLGLNHAKSYGNFVQIGFEPEMSQTCYCFGSEHHTAIGERMLIKNSADTFKVLIERVNIVSQDVPFPIGNDTMTTYKMYVDTVRDQEYLPHLR